MEDTAVNKPLQLRCKLEKALTILLNRAYAKLKARRVIPLPPQACVDFVIARNKAEHDRGLKEESGYNELKRELWEIMLQDSCFSYVIDIHRQMRPKPLIRLRVRCPEMNSDDLWYLHQIETAAIS